MTGNLVSLLCEQAFFDLRHSKLTCKTSCLRMCPVVGKSSFGTRRSQRNGIRGLFCIVLTWCLQVLAYCSLGVSIVLTWCAHTHTESAHIVLFRSYHMVLTLCFHSA